MTIELICALVTVGGTIVSALIAWLVSRSTANKEIEKMKLSWEREDIISSDDEFADMCSASAKYIAVPYDSHKVDSMGRIAALRAKESGQIAEHLDFLYESIRRSDRDSANAMLSKVVEEKRKSSRNANTNGKKKPTK